jgi:hypothetical protein
MVLVEEQKAGFVMFFTGALLISALLLELGVFTGYVLWGLLIIILAIVVLFIYIRLLKTPVKIEQDERTSMCSLRATRNSYFVAMMTIAFWAALIAIGAHIDALWPIFMVWGFSMAAYGVSYILCTEAV